MRGFCALEWIAAWEALGGAALVIAQGRQSWPAALALTHPLGGEALEDELDGDPSKQAAVIGALRQRERAGAPATSAAA